jgi:hypothetical protein
MVSHRRSQLFPAHSTLSTYFLLSSCPINPTPSASSDLDRPVIPMFCLENLQQLLNFIEAFKKSLIYSAAALQQMPYFLRRSRNI